MNELLDDANKSRKAALHEAMDRELEIVKDRNDLKREEASSDESMHSGSLSTYASFPRPNDLSESTTLQNASNPVVDNTILRLKCVIIILLVSLVAVTIAFAVVLNEASPNKEKSLIKINRLSMNENSIPLLLELPQRSVFSISTALSKCLGVKSSNYDPRLMTSHKDDSIDFLSETSLCNLKEQNYRLRMFIVFQNPAVRIFEDYYKIIDGIPDEKTLNMNLTQYLNTPGTEDNSLVRSILCKTEGQITMHDHKKAESFLKNKATVFVSKNYRNVVKLFQKRFKPDLEESIVLKCIDNEYKEKSIRQASHVKNDFSHYLQDVYRTNFYDFRLYQMFASEED